MLVKIGDVNVAGPGFRIEQLSQKPNFNFSSNGQNLCASEDTSSEEELSFQVFALGGCELDDIYDLRVEALQDQLDLANSHSGHMVYYQRIGKQPNDYYYH